MFRLPFRIIFLSTVTILALGCKGNDDTKSPDHVAKMAQRPPCKSPGNKYSNGKIKIGLVCALTGELSPWGLEANKAAKLAVNEVNAKGGIHGKKIELIVEDSASLPEQAKNSAAKLISSGVLAMIGEHSSGSTAQVGIICHENGVPLITMATRKDLTAIGENIFRLSFSDDFQGPIMAKFAKQDLNLNNVAILTDKRQPYSTGLSKDFEKTFQRLGGKIISELFYETGQTEFTSLLTSLKNFHPEAVFISGYFTEVGPIARQMGDLGIKARLLGGDAWDTPNLHINGGRRIFGSYYVTHYSPTEKRPEVKAFTENWKKQYGGTPGMIMTALFYDSIMTLCDAIRRAKSLDSQSIMHALENTEDLNLVTGKARFKGNHGEANKNATIVEYTDSGVQFRKSYSPCEL